MANSFLASWREAWERPVSPVPLAAFRTLFGLFLFFYFLSKISRVPIDFSQEGVYLPFVLRDFAPPVLLAWGIYVLTLTATVLFTMGMFVRFVVPLTLCLFLHHYLIGLAADEASYDRLIVLCLLILSFAPSYTSLRDTISPWAQRLLCFQISIFYVSAGLAKTVNPAWRDGAFLVDNLGGIWGTSLAYWFVGLGLPFWVYDILTSGTIAVEVFIGVGLYVKQLRWVAILSGIFLHGSIAILFDIPQFFVCWAGYVLFLDPEDIGRFLPARLLRTRSKFQSRPAEAADAVAVASP